jgi:hypothetical protein
MLQWPERCAEKIPRRTMDHPQGLEARLTDYGRISELLSGVVGELLEEHLVKLRREMARDHSGLRQKPREALWCAR